MASTTELFPAVWLTMICGGALWAGFNNAPVVTSVVVGGTIAAVGVGVLVAQVRKRKNSAEDDDELFDELDGEQGLLEPPQSKDDLSVFRFDRVSTRSRSMARRQARSPQEEAGV